MKLLNEVVESPGLDVVRIVCLDKDSRVLLVQESDDPNWKLPGGKMHKGETVLAAAMREITEELGYELKTKEITNIVKRYIPNSPNYRYILRVQLDASKLQSTNEVTEFGYFSLSELPETRFAKHIISAVLFFS